MPCPLFPTQQEVARGSWAHCIEDVGTVRNQELCMEMGTMMGGLQSLGAPWATSYHPNDFSHTPSHPSSVYGDNELR